MQKLFEARNRVLKLQFTPAHTKIIHVENIHQNNQPKHSNFLQVLRVAAAENTAQRDTE